MDIEKIWREFHGPLHAFVVKRVSDENVAEDIVQDVFLKIIHSIDRLKEEEKVRTWIYTISRNAIIDYYRRKRLTVQLPDEIQVGDPYTEDQFHRELSRCIQPMINQLSENYKEAMELTEIKGMSQKELSQYLGMSLSGAKSRVQRGRRKLKELLLACCLIKTDIYGNIIDFQTKAPEASNKYAGVACECK